MKNLENYGVLEMNAQETISVEGGNPWYFVVGTAIAIGGAIDFAAGAFMEGWNTPK